MNTYEAKTTFKVSDGWEHEFSQADDLKGAEEQVRLWTDSVRIAGELKRGMPGSKAGLRAAEALVRFFAGQGRSRGVEIEPLCAECGEPGAGFNLERPFQGAYRCIDCAAEGART